MLEFTTVDRYIKILLDNFLCSILSPSRLLGTALSASCRPTCTHAQPLAAEGGGTTACACTQPADRSFCWLTGHSLIGSRALDVVVCKYRRNNDANSRRTCERSGEDVAGSGTQPFKPESVLWHQNWRPARRSSDVWGKDNYVLLDDLLTCYCVIYS